MQAQHQQLLGLLGGGGSVLPATPTFSPRCAVQSSQLQGVDDRPQFERSKVELATAQRQASALVQTQTDEQLRHPSDDSSMVPVSLLLICIVCPFAGGTFTCNEFWVDDAVIEGLGMLYLHSLLFTLWMM